MPAGEMGDLKERECVVSLLYVTTWGVFPALSQAVLIPVLATGLETGHASGDFQFFQIPHAQMLSEGRIFLWKHKSLGWAPK